MAADNRLIRKKVGEPDNVYEQVPDIEGIAIFNELGNLIGHLKGVGSHVSLDAGLRITESKALELFNTSGDRMGGLLASEDALELVGIDDSLNEKPVRLLGASTILQSESIGMKFQGTDVGNFLYCEVEYDVDGEKIYKIGTSPLDVVAYSEEFTSAADFTLTTAEAIVVSGLLANSYSEDFAVGGGSFRAENSSNNQVTIEYWITTNGAPPAADDIFEIIVPPRSGNNNGVAQASLTDTADAAITAGDTLQLTARVKGSGTVDITGSVELSTLRIQENVNVGALYGVANGIAGIEGGGVNYASPAANDVVLFFDQTTRTLKYCKFEDLLPESFIGWSEATAQTTDNDWTDVVTWEITQPPAGKVHYVEFKVRGKRTDSINAFMAQVSGIYVDGSVSGSTNIAKIGPSGINTRLQDDGGSNVIIQVRGRNNQDWDWNIEYKITED